MAWHGFLLWDPDVFKGLSYVREPYVSTFDEAIPIFSLINGILLLYVLFPGGDR
jgi:hypothetical protein